MLVDSIIYNALGWLDTETDPRGIVSKTAYDAKGRIWKTFENFTDGVPTNSSNKTTVYNYDGDANVVYYEVDLPGGAVQKTQYVFNATTAAGNDVTSNDVFVAVKYPDKSTGAPSSSEQETYTVNRLGDAKTLTDRNGTVHTFTFDVLGRQTADAVTTLGTGVDGAVRRLETSFNALGLPGQMTSFNAASAGTVVNQVQDGYNGLGQLTVEYQAHSGAVNTSTSPKVQYAYSEMAGGANNSRQTSMTYPNGRVLGYNYASGVDNAISRLSSITDGATTLESYSELGLDTIVKRAHPQSTYDQTFIKFSSESNGDAGDQYIGLDRFGRVADQRWMVSSTGTTNDRYQYGFDRDGNVLFRSNLSNHSQDELYHANGSSNGYDNLGQMTTFLRGTLSDTNSDGVPDTVASNSRSQSWSLDAVGNWSSITTNGTAQNRTANQQNQITSITGLTTPLFDADGHMTTDQAGKNLVYDAWGRPVAYKSAGTTLESMSYDALGRKIVENAGTAHDLYFSQAWQILEEDWSGSAKIQNVWSAAGIDIYVERDRDADGNTGNGLEERLFVEQDANGNVTALVDTAGTVQERYQYDPYGAVTILTAAWGARGSSSCVLPARLQNLAPVWPRSTAGAVRQSLEGLGARPG